MHFSFSFGTNRPTLVERTSNGWGYFYDPDAADLKKFKSEKDKVNAAIYNPAALKLFTTNADLFSISRLNSYRDGKVLLENALYGQKSQPNLQQSWTQFFWDYMFWLQTGTAFLYNPNNSKALANTSLIWLNPGNIQWEADLLEKLKDIVLSSLSLKEKKKGYIKYHVSGSKTIKITLDEITPFFDLTNGIDGNPYNGISRLDALTRIITNVEENLKAKTINLKLSRKFIINGKNAEENITALPMDSDEKQSVERAMLSDSRSVHTVKTPIDVNRMVQDISRLQLDQMYNADMHKIAALYGLPKELLDIDPRGTTYENQEKAMARHVDYFHKPKGQQLSDFLETQFGFEELRFSWDHCAFNQVFEKERADKVKVQLENIQMAIALGLDQKAAAAMVNQILGQ